MSWHRSSCRKSSLALDSEIYAQPLHARAELGVRDHVDDAAMLHDVVAIRHRLGELDALLDEQDRESLGLEPLNRGADLLHDHRGETLGRLIEQEEARAGAQDA